MLENPLRRSAKNSSPNAASVHRPDSPVVKPQHVGPSFAQRKALQSRPSDAVLVEGNDVMRSIDRPLPGDVVGRRKPQLHPDAGRKKSAYFETEFAGPNRGDDPVNSRILNEAIVTAELKTNVIISDEFSFITDLAYHLSNRYQRPMTSISITLQHGVCMLFGGTFDPAYTLTIHALPSLLQPATNRRNAILIQRHLLETLGVALTRGYILFDAVPKENIAIGGKTLAAETTGITEDNIIQTPSEVRKPSKSARGIMKSVKSLGSFKSHSMIDLPGIVPTPPSSNSGEMTHIATIPEGSSTPPEDEKRVQVEGQQPRKSAPRRKSFRVMLFGNRISADN